MKQVNFNTLNGLKRQKSDHSTKNTKRRNINNSRTNGQARNRRYPLIIPESEYSNLYAYNPPKTVAVSNLKRIVLELVQMRDAFLKKKSKRLLNKLASKLRGDDSFQIKMWLYTFKVDYEVSDRLRKLEILAEFLYERYGSDYTEYCNELIGDLLD